MPTKKKAAMTYLPLERHAQLEAVAAAQGQSVSAFLGRLIDIVLEEGEAPALEASPSKSRREGKVTARLPKGVREKLEEEAKARGVTVSTWVGSMLQARYRRAPQPLPPDRALIQRAFRHLRGVAVNINQIAYALNRGVLTGAGAELTADELRGFSAEIAAARRELGTLASGKYEGQALRPEDCQS